MIKSIFIKNKALYLETKVEHYLHILKEQIDYPGSSRRCINGFDLMIIVLLGPTLD